VVDYIYMRYFYFFVLLCVVLACNTDGANVKEPFAITNAIKPHSYSVAEAVSKTDALEADTADVLIQGISWGVYDVFGGDVVLNLGDSTQKNEEIASLVCLFPAHQKEFISIAQKDALVKIKGKIRKTRYHTSLYNCKLVSVEFPN
jgi:hypothetical protein